MDGEHEVMFDCLNCTLPFDDSVLYSVRLQIAIYASNDPFS
jgi:hypothetical protein